MTFQVPLNPAPHSVRKDVRIDFDYNKSGMRKIVSFIFGVIIFSGLPLLAWGLSDLYGFILNPYRLAYILMMATLSLLVVVFVPNQGKGYGEGRKLVKRQKLSLLLLQIVPLFILLLSAYSDRHGIGVFKENNSIRLIGLIASFLGFLFMNWSILILGRQFSVDVTIQDNHKLITSGPYKYIRHPRYLGILVFFGGISIIFLSWVSLLLVLFLMLILLWRIKDEEKLMHQEFKIDWLNYKKRTYALIPFIY